MRVITARCPDAANPGQKRHCEEAKSQRSRLATRDAPARACDKQRSAADGPVRRQRAPSCQQRRQRAVQGGSKKGASAEERVDAVQVRPGAFAVLLRDKCVGCYADLRGA